MVPAAQRCQVALAGQPTVVPGQRVVVVAGSRGSAASPVRAGRCAGVDLVPELAARPVPGLGIGVLTRVPRDRVQADPEPVQESRDYLASGTIAVRRAVPGRQPNPRLGPAGTAMRYRPSLLIGDGHAPSCARMLRGR